MEGHSALHIFDKISQNLKKTDRMVYKIRLHLPISKAYSSSIISIIRSFFEAEGQKMSAVTLETGLFWNLTKLSAKIIGNIAFGKNKIGLRPVNFTKRVGLRGSSAVMTNKII
jgi:hypothetical protein